MSTNNNPVNRQTSKAPVAYLSEGCIFRNIFIRIYFCFEIVVVSILLTFKSFLWIFLPRKSKSLKHQVALITGSGNGLGREIALQLAKEGCHIAVVDVDLKAAEETKSLAKTFNVNAKAYKIDVSSLQQIEKLKCLVEEDLGHVDILINNAGIVDVVRPYYTKAEDIDRVFQVNILHHFWTTQTFLKGMIERKKGHIVGICSVNSYVPVPGTFTYSTTKPASNGYMNSLTSTLIRNNHDYIKTTSVYPYITATRAAFVEEVRKYRISELFPVARSAQTANDIVNAIKSNKRKIFVPPYFSFICGLYFLTNTHFQGYTQRMANKMY